MDQIKGVFVGLLIEENKEGLAWSMGPFAF